MKYYLILLLFFIPTFSDEITLQNDHKIYGIIQKFDRINGIEIKTDTGIIAIPPDQFQHCRISAKNIADVGLIDESEVERNREEIINVVKKNILQLRLLHENYEVLLGFPIDGKIFVHFSINGKGDVIKANIQSSEIKVKEFNNAVIKEIKKFKFNNIGPTHSITEIVYPFIFKSDKISSNKKEFSETNKKSIAKTIIKIRNDGALTYNSLVPISYIKLEAFIKKYDSQLSDSVKIFFKNDIEDYLKTSVFKEVQSIYDSIYNVYDSIYNIQELTELLKFYKSPIGKKLTQLELKLIDSWTRFSHGISERVLEGLILELKPYLTEEQLRLLIKSLFMPYERYHNSPKK